MRSSKINYLIVGLFVIAMIVGLVGSIAVLTGRTGAVDGYYTVYDNVTGVKFGTQVVYEGYPIGQVESVTPQDRNNRMKFRVDFTVTEGWRIPEDSQVEIAAPNLLSAVALQIHAGVSTTALSPSDRVNSRAATNVFGAVSSLTEQLANLIEADAKPLIRHVTATVQDIQALITSDGNVMIRDITDLVRDITERIPIIADDIQAFAGNMETVSGEIMKVVSPKNLQTIEAILAQMDRSTKEFDNVLASMDKVLEDLDRLVVDPKADIETTLAETRYIVESVSRHIDSINQNMESAARNMNEFSRQIRGNPGLLLGGTPQQDQEQRP